MIEIKANIWDNQFDGMWRVIPINCQINSKGELIMGAGLAKEAKFRYPSLPKHFANLIYDQERRGQPIFPLLRWIGDQDVNLMGFPTKRHWRDKSNLSLIEEGLIFLQGLMPYLMCDGEREKAVCPRLGCGERTGRLDWEREVRPLFLKYFENDDNLIVVSL